MRKDERGEETGTVFVCLYGGAATPFKWDAENGAGPRFSKAVIPRKRNNE